MTVPKFIREHIKADAKNPKSKHKKEHRKIANEIEQYEKDSEQRRLDRLKKKG